MAGCIIAVLLHDAKQPRKIKRMTKAWDIIIIGAGAAGLMAAITAGKRGRSVLLLEHNDEPGRKILISGGGRCNFTNMYATPENYLSKNPHFCKSALARFTPWDFIALVEQHGIQYYEKKLGQLFCRDSAQQIVNLLLSEAQQAGVVLKTGVKVQDVTIAEQGFQVDTSEQELFAEHVILACGGLSIPKIGASDLGYRLLKQFGHKLVEPRPALVPLTHKAENHDLTELRGISVDVNVQFADQSFRENLLFTHFGLSGPAILQISSYWEPGQSLNFDFLPDHSLQELWEQGLKVNPDQHMHSLLRSYLPQRFIHFWKEHYFRSKSLQAIQLTELKEIEQALKFWRYQPAGSSGYVKAEVTRGGADTDFFSSKTMESQKIAGLFCIGELMDVTGWLGGYNFQWAWASGYAAGLVA